MKRVAGTLVAAATLACLLGAAARAQDEASALTFAPDVSNRLACEVVVAPAAQRGPQAPALRLTVAKDEDVALTPLLVLRTDAPGAQLVAGDARAPFGRETVDLRDPPDEGAWARLMSGAPFHLTVGDGAGGWSTTRFEAQLRPRHLRKLRNECRVDAELLQPLADRLANNEAKLGLTEAQLRRVRRSLASLPPRRASPPYPSAALTAEDRRRLLKFTDEAGLPPSRYLTKRALNRLERIKLQPAKPNYRSFEGYRAFQAWSYREEGGGADRSCHVHVVANATDDLDVWVLPRLEFIAMANAGEGKLIAKLPTPNPFVGQSPVAAQVGARAFPMTYHAGFSSYLPEATGEFMRAVARSSSLTMSGRGDDGEPLTLTFSAMGFTRAFNHMMNICGRKDLSVWLN
ncbi:MAG: hypothetical protein AAFU61_04365 [Pseudomonadota bacterium]